MESILNEKSSILALKSKFFIYRALSYSIFLLVPVLLPKSLLLPQEFQHGLLLFFILFLMSQWFLLGKEIDHRLKIYFRVNSSLDRIVYRLLLGMVFFILYFNLLYLFPPKWINNLFWVTWVILGLFYSWPPRGKIIEESVTSHLTEFKYLDRFEKTLLGLIILFFIVSIPEIPRLVNKDALKLFFDPTSSISAPLWNYLTVNYYPFIKYPELFRVGWSMHFYVVGMGLYLLTLYPLLRFFFSRRLSLLGVFALISSWSFSKFLASNYGDSLLTTFSILFVWSSFWAVKSSTYRAGLFVGLVGFLGTLINSSYILISVLQLASLYLFFLKENTRWYRVQFLRYALFGFLLSLGVLLTNDYSWTPNPEFNSYLLLKFVNLIESKAFFSISIFGLLILLIKYLRKEWGIFQSFDFKFGRSFQLVFFFSFIVIFSLFWAPNLVRSFGIIWFVAFLSLIPLELLFQSLSRLRSKRNIIYVVYILICLLDSHLEGRVKIFIKFFDM